MLIAPIWILAFTHAVVLKLTVITIFILLFLGLVVLGTNAKAYETLAATAAYVFFTYFHFIQKKELSVADCSKVFCHLDGVFAAW